MCAQNYENWPTVDKVIAKISRLIFWPTLYFATLFYWHVSGFLRFGPFVVYL